MNNVDHSPAPKRLCHQLLVLAVTGISSLLAAGYFLGLAKGSFRVPLAYHHDSMPVLTWIKSTVQTGWWVTNDRLGVPGRMEMQDYPTNPHLHMVMIRLLSWFSSDPGLLLNLYFLLTFPLIALAALVALRSMTISPPFAMVGAIIYSLLPYHFRRGESHLFLAAYYMVPLTILVVVWVWQTDNILVRRSDTGRLRLSLWNCPTLAGVLICLALGFDSTYYPLFAAYFLLVGGLASYFLTGNVLVLLRAALLIGVVGIGLTLNLAPNFLYWWEHGPNRAATHASKRPWHDAEAYGLKVVSMLLPAQDHRIPGFRQLRSAYDAGTLISSSGGCMALGLVGSAGLLLLTFRLLMLRRANSSREQLYQLLSTLMIFGVLLGTIDGMGSLFNLALSSMLRCYDRLSIFIGLFALAAAMAFLDDLSRRFAVTRARACITYAALAGLLAFALFDQTGQVYVAARDEVKQEYRSDADFVHRVEASVPPGTWVFQFPYVSWLSYNNAVGKMLPYSHFRGFIHSESLGWSFGAMHGRATDRLLARIASQPVEGSLRKLALLGFGGIYVDRWGYSDGGHEVETKLRQLLATEPVVSANQRLSFFNMSSYVQALRAACSADEWARERQRLYDGPYLEWGAGFFAEEREGNCTFRWCGSHGKFHLMNAGARPYSVVLRFRRRTLNPGPAQLAIHSELFSQMLPIDANWTEFYQVIQVPPGEHLVSLDCSATPYVHPSRTIVFALADVEVRPDEGRQRLANAPPALTQSTDCWCIPTALQGEHMDYPVSPLQRITPDVRIGRGVKIYDFVNLYGCSIGEDSKIGTFVEIQKNSHVGARCKISSHTFICEGVVIEDDCFIGHHVCFLNDLYPRATSPAGALQTEADWQVIPTRVCRGASIGSGAVILAGVTIGPGALVGAGAVVTRNVAAGQVVAGVPARMLRSLHEEAA